MRNPANKQTNRQTDTRRWLQYPAFRGITSFFCPKNQFWLLRKNTQILLADALPPKFELIGISIFIGRYNTRTADEKNEPISLG